MHCNIPQHTATYTASHCKSLQVTATRLQHDTTHTAAPPNHCNTQITATSLQLTLQDTATLCNTLQHTATHCTSLRLTATHCNTHVCMYAYICVCVCEYVRVYKYFYTYIYVCGRKYKVVCMVANSMYALSHEAHSCYASLICIYHATSLNASWRTSE